MARTSRRRLFESKREYEKRRDRERARQRRRRRQDPLSEVLGMPRRAARRKMRTLGHTARKILNWPPPEKPRKPAPLHPHRPGHEE